MVSLLPPKSTAGIRKPIAKFCLNEEAPKKQSPHDIPSFGDFS